MSYVPVCFRRIDSWRYPETNSPIAIGAIVPSIFRQPGYLRRYRLMTTRASGQVIAAYSTSFSLATRLLAPSIRVHIRNLYAMVRIADEIVDGTASEAGMTLEQIESLLDGYETAVLAAPKEKFLTDPVLHSWAQTARQANIPAEYVTDFFAAMRRDLHQATYANAKDLDEYVYGSAEVIGLMCLRIFFSGEKTHTDSPAEGFDDREFKRMEASARRFGAALQKVNFLRDLGEDSDQLGRQYFPSSTNSLLTNAEKDEVMAQIREDLTCAWEAIPALPGAARAGVLLVWLLFNDLTNRLESRTVNEIRSHRVRVPAHVKARFGVKAVVQSLRM